MKKERRDFLKVTAAGATGLALGRARQAQAAWPTNGKMEINPDIGNMRVVGLTDPKMMKSVPSNMTFATQNDAVDWPRVQANMDAMAVALTQKSTADEAWKTVFRSSKPWADTVVAVKVNAGEARNTARLAVLQKFSNLFVDWGVKPQNFIVYDGHSPATNIFASSFSTTDKNKVLGVVGAPSGQSGDLLGGWKDAKLASGATRRCAAKIADGTVDILINIANNKGHMMFGKVTLCMKNHYGTWEPDATHTDLNNLIYSMNKADAIIGGDPPRQQLCFVDSMFCNKADIFGQPELMPCYFVMGTFAPAVDYLLVKKVREEVSKLSHDSATVNSYLTGWGYTTSDPEWILVPPAADTPDAGPGGSGGAGAGDTSGSGGANAGGASGSGGSGGGGGADASGTGGSAGGGGRRDGGVSRDVASRTGGSGAGGKSGSAGADGSGGASAGGSSGAGGVASGGASGMGGSGSGGTTSSGGSSAGGSGGAQTSASASGSGGSPGSGGSSGQSVAASNLGCGCEVAGARAGGGGLGAGLLVGALVAGQLRRLFLRRETLAQPTPSKKEAEPSSATPADEERGLEHGKEKT
ncbi:MAG: DUF362 domain-containing protein [Deltaproteobacteria bacterium]|nr:DUF362 domain-containing protein [Deltaproteobacteria bacterium]